MSVFAQVDMAITNAAAGDFIIRKKRNKNRSNERLQEPIAGYALHAKNEGVLDLTASGLRFISAFRFQLCAFDLQSRPAKI